MKKTPFAVLAFAAFCLTSILSSCQSLPSWHLKASKLGDTVQLCLSQAPECPQPGGVSPSSITVYRYDNLHDNELVWDAEPESETSGNFDGVVTYGVPPKNWRNELTPPALVCGKAYLVNPPATLFALKCDGTVMQVDFPHLEEFFRDNAQAVPAK